MKTKLTLVIALPILSLLACGGKSDAEKFADEFCGEISKCCAEKGLPSDGKTCRMLMGMSPGYNASAGEACLAEVRAQVSAGNFCQSTSSPQSSCSSVYSASSGDKKPGEACTNDADCAKSDEGQVVCKGTSVNGQSVEKCQIRITGKAGEACVGTQDGDMFYGSGTGDEIPSRVTVCNIADGLRCDGSACVALTAVGGSCFSSNDCVRSAYCDSSQGKCATRIAIDGACAGRSYNDCVAGGYCNSTSKRCTPQLANGATCSTGDMCLSGSCSGTVCADIGATVGLGLLCTTF
jgi:hypothetical protein